ncbi:hypothetical protein AMTR_s00024p00180240 [Amborella trichopoda]|uniref:Aminotransferase-like plant mobile domain-containing protein n=1 Tax=Amborella trichopoda TaxID=13333 RepID=W1PTW7_AMBTC|nr:hypothetical protein AMTR_s00024p00180240 [Amborella trichopoda]
MEDNLGIVPYGNLASLRHTWLKANFKELPPDATPVQVYRYTRAYLLFLINVTIFVDASVSTVPKRYLQFFKYIEGTSTYAWGAAALAFLYLLRGKLALSSDDILVIWNPYFNPDEVIPDDRQQAFHTAMCPTALVFDDIAEPYMPDRVWRQFEAKHGIPKNPLVVSKRASR